MRLAFSFSASSFFITKRCLRVEGMSMIAEYGCRENSIMK